MFQHFDSVTLPSSNEFSTVMSQKVAVGRQIEPRHHPYYPFKQSVFCQPTSSLCYSPLFLSPFHSFISVANCRRRTDGMNALSNAFCRRVLSAPLPLKLTTFPFLTIVQSIICRRHRSFPLLIHFCKDSIHPPPLRHIDF